MPETTALRALPRLPEPTVDRPRMPKEYGMPAHDRGLRPWSEVLERLTASRTYWIATAGLDGQPRSRPVDGLVVDGRLFVGGNPETRWARDLEANPKVSIHLEDAWDVVIIEGHAELLHGVVPELAERLAAASNAKYPQYGVMSAADYAGPGPYVIHPHTGFAWTSFPTDLTRYRFAPESA